jgi:pimeloyl-ACP methyl ester carboxylesterase
VGAAGDSGGSSGAGGGPAEIAGRYAAEQQAAGRRAPQPTLYLHGAADGCIRVDLARGAGRLLAPSSRMAVIENAGHFLHLEKPTEVNEHILTWITAPSALDGQEALRMRGAHGIAEPPADAPPRGAS